MTAGHRFAFALGLVLVLALLTAGWSASASTAAQPLGYLSQAYEHQDHAGAMPGDQAGATPQDHAAGGNPGHASGASGHEGDEGLGLAAGSHAAATPLSAGCAAGARVRAYDVVAIKVDMTMNRYLDHDPEGRMYVLEEDRGRVRDEEQRNARARTSDAEPAVTVGLQGDAIQPLTLRVGQGECLRIRLRNDLGGREQAGIQVHGAGLRVADDGSPAIGTNARALVPPGGSVTYEWNISTEEREGTHYFHSPGDDRFQTGHGLFGAVVVEPQGSTYLDPATGHELRSGWSAVIRTPEGRTFREAVLYYHEVGNETYQFLDRAGNLVPLVDPITTAYRPGARALNYRSEPFMNRLLLQRAMTGTVDESVVYGSYTFGDPATPIIRSYLADPLKQRVVHGGSEVFHVHHVHGGSIRWRRQPGAEAAGSDGGLDKRPPLVPSASERIDSQSIGPSETYDVENECGAGGCQQSVGDFLIHCHVAHHYFAGMWGLWRVYNTLQDGRASTDALPPLLELPDRAGRVLPGITSAQLVGRTVDSYGERRDVTDLAQWVESQLPPPGVPRGYDAAVLDWRREGDVYVNEVEDSRAWPGFRSTAPGTRPAILFDAKTGKLAYPFLRPHLGKRPPFAPNHGPAPYLDPFSTGVDPPAPGANGPGSVCPAGTRRREFAVNAITTPVALNRRQNLVDPRGQLFALREDLARIRADERQRVPLTIRANAGEDCVDLLFRSDLEDTPDDHDFSKVNLHIHLVQFDVQASDGVIAGFNYEQSVRPYRLEGEKAVERVAAGAIQLRLSSTARFQPGILVGVGMDQEERLEIVKIAAVQDDTLIFATPLRYPHDAGEIVSTEFVRYRWYPDAQVGTVYFHDHVNAIFSWRHGLFGALVVEPPGSTYHDPYTGREVRSGTAVDVVTTGAVSADVRGSFREFAMFLQDDVPITHIGRSSGSAINLRAEQLEDRGGDPARRFSSQDHGDPATPLLEAYLGDPVVVRLLVGATNDVHTFHLDGHQFRAEPFSATSEPVSTVHVGISERYDLSIERAGGVAGMPGDYLYYNGRALKLVEGSWGIFRVHDAESRTTLRKLPGRESVPAAAPAVCPAATPQKRFAVSAIEVPLPMLGGAAGRVYALRDDVTALRSGARAPEPLVLRVGVGDCVTVELTNELRSDSVSFHADMLAADPRTSGGVTAGYNATQTVAPGATRTFTYYAHPAIGETVALVRDWGNVAKNPRLGLYGAIVVGPAGARYSDPRSGEDVAARSSWSVDVHPATGMPYRDFALFLQEEDATIGTHRMPYTEQVEGVVGLNYRAAPLRDQRTTGDGDGAALVRSRGVPSTPLLEAIAGDAVRIHVLLPWAEQAHVFSLEGHRWPFEPGRSGGDLLSSVQVGGLEAVTLRLEGGAGNGLGLSGDFLYGDHRLPYRDAGLWGLFRVHLPCASGAPRPLMPGPNCDGTIPVAADVALAVVLALGGGAAAAIAFARRRRRVR